MTLPAPICLVVSDTGQVGHARRAAVELAEQAGFDEIDAGEVAIVVSELATNLAKHAGGGIISLRLIVPTYGSKAEPPELEVVCVDSGRGIADVAKCFEDGYSTTGTPGSGLGAVRRMARVFDLYSQPGKGTVQAVRMARRTAVPAHGDRIKIGGISVPIPGETECGDAWSVSCHSGTLRILVVDGLGHGPVAAAASREAVQVFQDSVQLPVTATLMTMHSALRATRGAAVALAEIDLQSNTLCYAGVGNISAHIARPETARVQNLVSINGTLGCLSPKIKEFIYPLTTGSRIVFYSDGLLSQVRLDGYPGLVSHHPAVVAGVLYRDFQRGRDDATVVVADLD